MSSEAQSSRPAVAIICNSIPPYRVHLHTRIAREMPEIELWTVCTHAVDDGHQASAPPAEIRPVLFGQGEPSSHQGRVRYAWSEWRKGGRIIRRMKDHAIRGVVVSGYSDTGRLRIIRWCRKQGIPWLLAADSNIRSDRASGLKKILKTQMLRRLIRSATAILPFGRLGKEYFVHYGADSERIFLFPLEPDYDLISNVPAAAIEELREKYRLPPAPRLLYVGRLIAAKRVDLLIDAFSAIASQRPSWRLMIVGDGPLRAELEQRVSESLRHRLDWLGIVRNASTIAGLYRMGDVLVVPSDYEPWGLVVNEGLAAGLPVVASSIVGAGADLIEEGVNGAVFVSGDLSSLKQTLMHVTDPGQLDRLQSGSRAVLARWRARADPIAGLRASLRAAGMIQ